MTATARPTSARVAAARRKAADRQRAVIAALESGDDYDRIRVPLQPSGAWFREVPSWYSPDGPLVQLAVTGPESGRVACLVAPYTECILDGKQGCWKPGMSKTGYEYAHVGHVTTAEGETIRTANVGGGINHFNPHLATAVSLAADHYANTATRRMVGRYVDVPEIGVMFLGMLYPGTTHEQAFECMTSALSGDWRWVESLGDHEMVGSQLVNNPGFRPNPLRPVVLASVSFRSEGTAKVASLGQCAVPEAIFSEWTPLNDVIEDVAPTLGQRIAARIAGVLDALAPVVIDATPMVDMPPDPVNIMDLDDDGDEGEDWADELADLTDDECRHCRGDGCAKCGWLGYTGPDDDALLASLEGAYVAAARPRDGDGDGFVYDGTPRQRPYNPLTDLQGTSVSLDILKRAAAGDTGAHRDIAKRATDNAGKARKTRKRPERRNFIESTLGDRPTDANSARAWDEAAQLVDREYSRQFGTPQVPQRRADAPIVDESPGGASNDPSKGVAVDAVRLTPETGVNPSVYGPKGYRYTLPNGRTVDVAQHAPIDVQERGPGGQTRFVGDNEGYGGVAKRPKIPTNRRWKAQVFEADGTPMRRSTVWAPSRTEAFETARLRAMPDDVIVDESPGRGKPGDQPEQLDLFGEAMVDPEPMPEPRPVTIDGDTEIPDEGTPEDLSGQTRILTPAEKSDTPIGKFRDTVAKLATREDTANADPKNGMAGMKADAARGRRNTAREAARADGYTDEQLDAVEANERARWQARRDGTTAPELVDPPAPEARPTPDPTPTPAPVNADEAPPADVQALLDRFQRSTPDSQPAPFTPDEIRAIARWEHRNDGPEWLDRIENGAPKVYVTTEVDGRNYYRVRAYYVIEAPDGKEVGVPEAMTSRIRTPKDRIPGGPDADYRRGIAEKWMTPGVEARTFHLTAKGRKEDPVREAPPVRPDEPDYSLRPGPGGSKLVYNGDNQLIGDVRPTPDGAWNAHDGDSGRLLGRFASSNEAARAVARNKASAPVDTPEPDATPDAPETPETPPTPDVDAPPPVEAPPVPDVPPVPPAPEPETPAAPDEDIDLADLEASDTPEADDDDRIVPTRGGFRKLPKGVTNGDGSDWGADLSPSGKRPGQRTEAGAQPRAGDKVILENNSGKQTTAYLLEEAAPNVWTWDPKPPEGVDDPDAPDGSKDKYPPTPEQQAAIDLFHTGDDMLIVAGAGAGKTATLVQIANNEAPRKGMYLAFGRALKDEAEGRMPRNVTALGFHQLAWRGIVRDNPKLLARLGNKKRLDRKVEAQILGLNDMTFDTESGDVRLAAPFLAGVVMEGLRRFTQSDVDRPSWKHMPNIENDDFDDAAQIRMKKALEPFLQRAWADVSSDDGQLKFGFDHFLKMYQLSDPNIGVDFVLVDEAQDLAPVLRAIALGQKKYGTQLGFVGDPAQSIFGFTGAENAMKYLAETGAPSAELTKSFRFGPEVARVANLVLDRLPEGEQRLQIVGHDPIDSRIGTIDPDDVDVILTRTNAKAVTLALEFMRAGKKVAIAEQLKSNVIEFAKGAKDLDEKGYSSHGDLAPFSSWDEVKKFVEEDVSGSELQLLVKLVDDFGVDTILNELKNTERKDEDADIVLSTAHTSKGREWDNVVIGDDFPGRDEKTGEPPDLSPEEVRLLYVAVTRAKKRLDVDAVDWLFDGQGGDGGGAGPVPDRPDGGGDIVDESQVSLFDDGSDGTLPFGDTMTDPEPMPTPGEPLPAPAPAAEAPVSRPAPGAAAADVRPGDVIDFDAPNTASFVYAGTNPGLDPSTWDRPTGRLEVKGVSEVDAPAVTGSGRRFRLTLANGRDVVVGESDRLMVRPWGETTSDPTPTPDVAPDPVPEVPETPGAVDWGTATARRASGTFTSADGTEMAVDIDAPAGKDAEVTVKFADSGEVIWTGQVPRGDGDSDEDVMARARTLTETAAAAAAAGETPPDTAPEVNTPGEPDDDAWMEDPRWKRAPLEGTPVSRRLNSGVLDAIRATGFKIGENPEIVVRDGAIYGQYDAPNGGDGFISFGATARPTGTNTVDVSFWFATPGNTLDEGFELPLTSLDPTIYAAIAGANPELWESAAARQSGRAFGDLIGDRQIGGDPAGPEGWSMLLTRTGTVMARHDSHPEAVAILDRATGTMPVKDHVNGTEFNAWRFEGADLAAIDRIAAGASGGAPLADDNPFTELVSRAQSIADDPSMAHSAKVDALDLEGQALREAMLSSLPAKDWHTSPAHVRALTDYGRAVQAVTLQRAAEIPQGESTSEYRRHTVDTMSALDGILAALPEGTATLDTVKVDAIRNLFDGLDPVALTYGGKQTGGGHKSLVLRAQADDGTYRFARIVATRPEHDGPGVAWRVTIDWARDHDNDVFLFSQNPHPSLSFVAEAKDTKAINRNVRQMLKSALAAHRAWQLDPKDADGKRIETHPSDIVLSHGVSSNQAAAAAQEVLDRLVPGGRGLTANSRRRVTIGTGNRSSTIRPHRDTTPIGRAKASKRKTLTEEALANFPSSWVDGLGDYHFAIKPRGPASSTGTAGSNASNLATRANIALLDVPSEGAPDTVVHEFGHSFERVLPGLLDLTLAHLDQRLDPDEEAAILNGFNIYYGYHDEIRDEYAKRVYMTGGNRRPTGKWRQARNKIDSTEYLTTGLETLVPGSSRGDERHIGLDPERDGFVLGALILYDPQAQTLEAADMPAASTLVDASEGGAPAAPAAGPVV